MASRFSTTREACFTNFRQTGGQTAAFPTLCQTYRKRCKRNFRRVTITTVIVPRVALLTRPFPSLLLKKQEKRDAFGASFPIPEP